jgi:hypothetical protein
MHLTFYLPKQYIFVSVDKYVLQSRYKSSRYKSYPIYSTVSSALFTHSDFLSPTYSPSSHVQDLSILLAPSNCKCHLHVLSSYFYQQSMQRTQSSIDPLLCKLIRTVLPSSPSHPSVRAPTQLRDEKNILPDPCLLGLPILPQRPVLPLPLSP